MQIIFRISRWVHGKRGYIILVAIGLFALAGYLTTLDGIGQPGHKGAKLIYLVSCTIWIIATVFWLFVAGWFYRNAMVPSRLIAWRNVSCYKGALERYHLRGGVTAGVAAYGYSAAQHSPIDELKSQYHKDKHTVAVMVLATVVWLTYTALAFRAIMMLEMDALHWLFLNLLSGAAALLNGLTYYLCFSFVWLLKDIAHGTNPSKLPHLLRWPASTPELLSLSSIAHYNSMAFLASSLLCSIGVLLDVFLLPKGGDNLFPLIMVVFTSIVGLASYGVLVVMSHIFIGETVEKWEMQSVDMLAHEFGGKVTCQWSVNSSDTRNSAEDSGKPDADRAPDMESIVVRRRDVVLHSDAIPNTLAALSLAVDIVALFVGMQ